MNESIINIIKAIGMEGNKGCRFCSLTYTAKGTGEVARHSIMLGVNLERAYRRDRHVLQRHLSRCQSTAESQACQELIASLGDSLTNGIGNNAQYTQAGLWDAIPGLSGVRVRVDGTPGLQVFGMSRGKTVLQPGIYKTVKSSPKTLAKNALRKRMKSARFRAFVLENIQTAKVNGNVLEVA